MINNDLVDLWMKCYCDMLETFWVGVAYGLSPYLSLSSGQLSTQLQVQRRSQKWLATSVLHTTMIIKMASRSKKSTVKLGDQDKLRN